MIQKYSKTKPPKKAIKKYLDIMTTKKTNWIKPKQMFINNGTAVRSEIISVEGTNVNCIAYRNNKLGTNPQQNAYVLTVEALEKFKEKLLIRLI